MPQVFPEDAVGSPVTLLTSAGGVFAPTTLASATTVNSATQTNYFAHGLQVVLDITSITGTTPTLTLTIQGVDAASGKFYTLLASAALNGNGTTVFTIYPGNTVAANLSVSTVLPYQWRIIYVSGGTPTNITATIAAYVIP